MIVVIEMEILSKFQEGQMNELLALTAKDQIYLITREDGVLPVSMLPMLTKINAKLEVKTLPKNDSGFEKGFLYGSLSKSAGKEKVVILSGETAPSSLDENCAWNEGFGVKPKRKPAKAQKAAAPETAQKASEPAMKASEPAKKASESAKKTPADGLFSAPALSGCKDLLKGKEAVFRNVLSDASDSEIGYKMLLTLNFGKDGEVIWEQTHKQFKQLRKLL